MIYQHKFPQDFFAPESKEIVVRARTKKLWAILLDMLLTFDDVCKKHEIRYFLDSGSLLGAVRHGGFIPWDDDLDVVLLREEYDKLCTVAKDEFKYPFFFQTEYTDRGSARGHAQLRRSDTTDILKSEMSDGCPVYTFNQGVFLDIFALDSVPDDEKELQDFRMLISRDRMYVRKMRFYLYRHNWNKVSILHLRTIKQYLFSLWYRMKKRFFGVDELLRAYIRMERDVTKYNDKGMRRVANFSFNPLRKSSQIFDKRIYLESALYGFEGYSFPGPRDYEAVLRGHYGNWHEHVIGDLAHGGVFLDLDKSYTEYVHA